jgi:hypothetical protein
MRLKGYVNYTLDYKLKNELIYIIFMNINMNVLHLYNLKACSLIHFYLIIISKIRERMNKVKSSLTFIRVKVIVMNI